MTTTAIDWLARIRALPLPERIKVMNVCGGHERSITTAGLRKAIPSSIELVPGPGCPVCICPEEDIYEAIQLALHERVILVAYGDMLRVPVNAPKSEPRSLEQAKAAGADVRPISSPLEAARVREIALAAGRPDFLIVTPGVRPEGADKGDQQRVATPRAALEAGATHLVVARPVVGADNPLLAASTIVESIDGIAR
jgi:hypothetical protein